MYKGASYFNFCQSDCSFIPRDFSLLLIIVNNHSASTLATRVTRFHTYITPSWLPIAGYQSSTLQKRNGLHTQKDSGFTFKQTALMMQLRNVLLKKLHNKLTLELKFFLGLLNYYHKFLPNLSSMLSPLHQLLHKDTPWQWSKSQTEAFNQAKLMLQSSTNYVNM